MDASEVDLASVDLMDGAWHTDGPPQELLTRLRGECPVHAGVRADGVNYWSVTRDEDVVRVSRDPKTFSSNRAGIFLNPDQVAPLDLLRNVLLYKDPPEHSKFRRILSAVFTPKALKVMDEPIRARVASTIDKVIEKGECDFVTDIAVPIPLGVLATLMGIPDEDIPKLYTWTHDIERAQQSPEPAAATGTFVEMVTYLQGRVASQAAEGGDTLVTRLRNAEVDGERLTDDEILVFFGLLVFAGNDTTRNTTATGMLELLRHPDQWERLRADPSVIPNAVEEILRVTSVVKYFVRTVTADTELEDQSIPEGDKVVTWFSSASYDDSLNEDPTTFDITRTSPQHRAFGGGGPHFCLGNNLARMELRAIFEELARRMPDIALAGDVEYIDSNWAHGLTAMPVTFTPGPLSTAG